MSQLTTILSRVFKSWFHEIPLWLLLTIYCMAPAYFNGNIHSFNPVQIIYLFSESIAWTIPLTLLAHKRKWIWWSILTIATALFTIELFCLFNQQSRICTSLIIIALQTNTSEASEFVQNPDAKTALIYSAAISAAILFAAVFFHLKYSSTQHDKIRAFTSAQHHKICIRLLPFILLVVFSASIAVNIFIWNFKLDRWWKIMENSHLVVSPLLYLHSVVDIKQQRDAVNLDKLEQAIDNISVESTTPGDIHIVYVIGESHNRHRSSLYGYFLPTNPQLEKLAADSSLIVFQNAVAYSNSTKDVLCQLLSVQIVNDGSSFDSHPLLPAIFKKAGYHVAYFDNQSPPKGKKFDFSCNYFMSSPTIIDKTFSITNTETYTYDHQLIDNHPPLNTAKSLTIYHLKGATRKPKRSLPRFSELFHIRPLPSYTCLQRYKATTHGPLRQRLPISGPIA